jgi:molybdenum cofactor cytidylyltransferase/nicotine blue oxidoreductase
MGQPKACLPWGDGSLLEAQLRAALSAGCRRAVGVVREPVARQLARGVAGIRGSAEIVVSLAEPALGPAGSIAAFVTHSGDLALYGLAAISPVDVVPEAWRVLPALVRTVQSAGTIMGARPVHGGRGGHPVLIRTAVLKAYERVSERAGRPAPLREVLRALGKAVRDVEVDCPEAITDLDTPDDFARWAPTL